MSTYDTVLGALIRWAGDAADLEDCRAAAEIVAEAVDDARANRIPEREADYLSPDEQAFLAAERAADERACPACGGTGVRE